MNGLQTGFFEFDGLTGGLLPSDLVVVAGRPSMGKTAFVLTLVEYVAVEQQIPVGVFSLEMSRSQFANRMLGMRACVSQHRMLTQRLADSEWVNWGIAIGPMAEAKIFVDNSCNIGVLEIRAKAKRLMAQHQIGLLVVDYFQLIGELEEIVSSQQDAVFISNTLKDLAKELEIPVVVVSQLSRQVELGSGGPRPQLSDFGEFGVLERSADLVMLLYRPEMYHIIKDREGRSLEGVAEVIVAKQRNGPTGSVRLSFLKEYARFENMASLPEAVPSGGGPAPF